MSSEEIKELQECIQIIDFNEKNGTATECHREKRVLYQWLITELTLNQSYRKVIAAHFLVATVLGGLLLICLAKLQDPATIQAQFTDMSAEQRSEFIVWALTPEVRRAVAEDWCATNENTKRVCFNATKGD